MTTHTPNLTPPDAQAAGTDKYSIAPKGDKPRAVALISGGLDSLLAARVVQDQGVEVEGINFFTGFCVEGHTHAIRNEKKDRQQRNNALWVAEQLGIMLHIVDIVDDYKDVVLNPKHGYGKNLNPCLDCKVFMVGRAKQWIEENDFDFIITGEVMGQRPKSQMKEKMPLIARESQAQDRLLRPLSAKHLTETLPERAGWVRREEMHSFHGRNRKPQIALAAELGIEEWAQPAGGCCFLTQPDYSAKLQDLWDARGDRDYELDDILLLKVGRHFRPAANFKIIIARDEGESRYLRGYRKEFVHMEPVSHKGPLCLLDGTPNDADLLLAARLAARYSQGRDATSVDVQIGKPGGVSTMMPVTPLPADEVEPSWRV